LRGLRAKPKQDEAIHISAVRTMMALMDCFVARSAPRNDGEEALANGGQRPVEARLFRYRMFACGIQI
jgi:hypothetical protein